MSLIKVEVFVLNVMTQTTVLYPEFFWAYFSVYLSGTEGHPLRLDTLLEKVLKFRVSRLA